MAEGDVEIKVVATGAAQAAAEINKVADATANAARSAKDSGGSAQGLADAFQYLGLTMGAAQVLGAVKEWTLEADRLGDALSTLGGRSVEFANTLTYGAITQMDAAAARSRLLAAGLDLTDQQFGALAVKAAAFAQGSGQEASAVLGQLTGALIAGRDRGLLPFVGAMREGADRADIQTTALHRLTQEAAANERQLSQNAGTLDVLDLGWQRVKQQLGATTLAMLEVPFSTILPSIKDMNEALRGEQGAEGALKKVATRFLELGRMVPGAGGAIHEFIGRATGLIGPTNAAAAAARNLAGAMRSVAAAGYEPTQYQRGRDADRDRRIEEAGRRWDAAGGMSDFDLEMAQERAISDALSAPASGGGGGGGDRPGARGDIDWDISMAERRRIREEAEAREAEFDAAQQASASDGLFGMTDADFYAGSTGNTGAGGGGRRGRAGGINTAATPGARNTTGPAIDNLRALERTQGLVMGNMTNAVNQHVAAWMKGEESIGKAIKSILKETLAGIAIEAAIKAVLATAEGFFALASFNYPGATAAFTAAAYYGAAAAASGAGALAVGAIGGGGGGGRRDARSSTRDLGADRSLGGQGFAGPSVTINIAPGGIIGPDAAEVVGRLAVDGVNRGIRLGGMPRFDSSAIRTSGSRA